TITSPFSPHCFAFFFPLHGTPRDLHSFPTRRSSDLARLSVGAAAPGPSATLSRVHVLVGIVGAALVALNLAEFFVVLVLPRRVRSEEHTSELQSPCNLVCRLLLEKKKKGSTAIHQWV